MSRRCSWRIAWLLGILLSGAAAAAADAGKYAGSAACASCHPKEHAAWSDSHHARAMQPATLENVLGNFADARFTHEGIESHFFTREGKYFVRTEGADGKAADFPIAYTFGVAPLQQYLVPFPHGVYQALSIAWDSRTREQGGQRWYHLYPGERIDAKDPLHWTGPYQRWNSRCAECHSTGLIKGFDPATRGYATREAEIGVGCESCHGPSAAHVAAARAGSKLAPPVDPGGPGTWRFVADQPIAERSGATRQPAQLDVCAPCHSRRENIGPFAPGEPFLDHHVPNLLERPLYHADGQIDDEVFEYGSFRQSRMAQRGVTCSDCHEAHSARLRAEGNALCAQCHLPARYDAVSHHRHQEDGAGAACVNCHMPAKNYMVVDARRDHRFGIPDPWLAAEAKTPDACTGCHRERDAAWASRTLEGWGYRRRAEAPGSLLARARQPTLEGVRAGRALAADASAPPMQRATALAELRVMAERDLDLLAAAARDPEPVVRLGAARALAQVPPDYAQALLWPLLKDPRKAVRMEAARTLAAVPAEQLANAQRAERDAAVAEYLAAQDAAADLAGGPMNRAAIYLASGRAPEAERAYREALALEPDFVPGWINLADFYRAAGRDREAGEALQKALALAPGEAAVRFAWGLFLVREGKREEALEQLAQAAQLAPDEARYAYVYAVALKDAGRGAEAIGVARAAAARSPVDLALRELLVSLYAEGGRTSEAAAASRELALLQAELAR